MKNWIKIPEWCTVGCAFVYYWLISLYKLMQAPIWGDETMEFYCSIPVKGAIRGVTEYETMYERMIYIQQQPPLYNWLMCIWLKISENEAWYRFSSVIFGFIAVIGFYAVIKKLCNRFTATLAVLVVSSMYVFQYYVKEAAEYSLVVMLLIWTIYVFILLMEQITIKKIAVFTVLCVASVYTHYGAVFAVVPLAVIVLWDMLCKKDWKNVKATVLSYVVAACGAGIPLIVLFLIPQSTNSNSSLGVHQNISFAKGNILYDFVDSVMQVLRWMLLDYDRDGARFTPIVWVLTIGIILIAISVFVVSKRKIVRYILVADLAAYMLYYVTTKIGIYAYGWFGTRYSMVLFPFVVVTVIALIYESGCFVSAMLREKAKVCVLMLQVGVTLVAAIYCCYGAYRVHNHWYKSDERACVAAWYEQDAENYATFVNNKPKFTFTYYFTHNEEFQEEYWDTVNVNFNNASLEYSKEEWVDYLEKEVYPDGVPQTLFVLTSYRDALVEALESMGYEAEPLVETTAYFYKMTKAK